MHDYCAWKHPLAFRPSCSFDLSARSCHLTAVRGIGASIGLSSVATREAVGAAKEGRARVVWWTVLCILRPSPSRCHVPRARLLTSRPPHVVRRSFAGRSQKRSQKSYRGSPQGSANSPRRHQARDGPRGSESGATSPSSPRPHQPTSDSRQCAGNAACAPEVRCRLDAGTWKFSEGGMGDHRKRCFGGVPCRSRGLFTPSFPSLACPAMATLGGPAAWQPATGQSLLLWSRAVYRAPAISIHTGRYPTPPRRTFFSFWGRALLVLAMSGREGTVSRSPYL